jgi:metallo-beta-lactamase class B
LTTHAGHVLLDGGLPETAPMIAASVEALGFDLADVEVLLNSHAHFDHAGGLAELKERTGARFAAMAEDAEWLRTGHAEFGDFPAVAVDRELHDGEMVELGGTLLVAHRTAGHTPGCTTWTTTVEDAGKRYDVVFVCSPNALPQHRLVDNPGYPGIAADFERTFETLRALPVDVFLASHGSFFHLEEKRARMAEGGDGTVFVDPEGYRTFVAAKERAFHAELERQRAAHAGFQ